MRGITGQADKMRAWISGLFDSGKSNFLISPSFI